MLKDLLLEIRHGTKRHLGQEASRISHCSQRRSHSYRAEFVLNLSCVGRKIASQISAMTPKLPTKRKKYMVKTLFGAVAIAAVALAVGPAQAAKAVGCSGTNIERTESAINAMADGESRQAAQQEVAEAEELRQDGNMRGCAVHLSRALHDTQGRVPYAQAPGEPLGQAPGPNQWNWKPLTPGL